MSTGAVDEERSAEGGGTQQRQVRRTELEEDADAITILYEGAQKFIRSGGGASAAVAVEVRPSTYGTARLAVGGGVDADLFGRGKLKFLEAEPPAGGVAVDLPMAEAVSDIASLDLSGRFELFRADVDITSNTITTSPDLVRLFKEDAPVRMNVLKKGAGVLVVAEVADSAGGAKVVIDADPQRPTGRRVIAGVVANGQDPTAYAAYAVLMAAPLIFSSLFSGSTSEDTLAQHRDALARLMNEKYTTPERRAAFAQALLTVLDRSGELGVVNVSDKAVAAAEKLVAGSGRGEAGGVSVITWPAVMKQEREKLLNIFDDIERRLAASDLNSIMLRTALTYGLLRLPRRTEPPVNILLVGGPGAGKTFIATQLRNYVHMPLVVIEKEVNYEEGEKPSAVYERIIATLARHLRDFGVTEEALRNTAAGMINDVYVSKSLVRVEVVRDYLLWYSVKSGDRGLLARLVKDLSGQGFTVTTVYRPASTSVLNPTELNRYLENQYRLEPNDEVGIIQKGRGIQKDIVALDEVSRNPDGVGFALTNTSTREPAFLNRYGLFALTSNLEPFMELKGTNADEPFSDRAIMVLFDPMSDAPDSEEINKINAAPITTEELLMMSRFAEGIPMPDEYRTIAKAVQEALGFMYYIVTPPASNDEKKLLLGNLSPEEHDGLLKFVVPAVRDERAVRAVLNRESVLTSYALGGDAVGPLDPFANVYPKFTFTTGRRFIEHVVGLAKAAAFVNGHEKVEVADLGVAISLALSSRLKPITSGDEMPLAMAFNFVLRSSMRVIGDNMLAKLDAYAGISRRLRQALLSGSPEDVAKIYDEIIKQADHGDTFVIPVMYATIAGVMAEVRKRGLSAKDIYDKMPMAMLISVLARRAVGDEGTLAATSVVGGDKNDKIRVADSLWEGWSMRVVAARGGKR